MANKYKKFSKAHKVRLIVPDERDSLDVFDEDHKENINLKLDRASRAFAVAKEMYAVLHGSKLDATGRTAAMQLLMALQGPRGGKNL